ncbi:hypothetical protein [Aestuariirhabdus sp. LZHN29]|uniref:hypothetical protein n=1 Tax=Aestuariirhabdus sp. LZHN29 TaxID=3417462 RepID=UPI003CEB1CB0
MGVAFKLCTITGIDRAITVVTRTVFIALLFPALQATAQEFDFSLPPQPRTYPGEDYSAGQHPYSRENLFSLASSPDFKFRDEQDANAMFNSVGKSLYEVADNPDKALRKATFGAVSAGLDAIGMFDAVEDSIKFLKSATRYRFGDCSRATLRQKFQLESCLDNDSSISIRSDYQMDSLEVGFKWSF